MVPPPVLIEGVLVDGQLQNQKLTANDQMEPAVVTVPPGKGRLEIQYTALSFSAPEKVRFKFRM
jgi:hypothetical protein